MARCLSSVCLTVDAGSHGRVAGCSRARAILYPYTTPGRQQMCCDSEWITGRVGRHRALIALHPSVRNVEVRLGTFHRKLLRPSYRFQMVQGKRSVRDDEGAYGLHVRTTLYTSSDPRGK
ncbi:hypothetical protein FKP32DRAFT_620907 [Trametes sanguinea]|nr:hypothetical protein FKP32DRAFT_620907 [Trametes sanguinea]